MTEYDPAESTDLGLTEKVTEIKPPKKKKSSKKKEAQPKKMDMEQSRAQMLGIEATPCPTKPDPIGKNHFQTMFNDGWEVHSVMPIQGVGCVLRVNGQMLFLPNVRYVDGAIIK